MIHRRLLLITFCIVCVGLTTFGQSVPKQPGPKSAPKLKDANSNRYRLNPGDEFEILYRYTPEFNQTVTVQPDGYVTLRVVNEVKVKGLTLPEIRERIARKAKVRLKDPEITLLLKKFRKPFFVVAGEVTKPGRFDMTEDTTALQAVLFAGGFTENAKSSQIVVYRKISSKYAEVKVLNLRRVRNRNVLEEDLTLMAGDMIFVPRNKISKVERIVRLVSVARIFPFL